jgi:hypothetical protein
VKLPLTVGNLRSEETDDEPLLGHEDDGKGKEEKTTDIEDKKKHKKAKTDSQSPADTPFLDEDFETEDRMSIEPSSATTASTSSHPTLLATSGTSPSEPPTASPTTVTFTVDVRALELRRLNIYTESSRAVFQSIRQTVLERRNKYISDNGLLNTAESKFIANWEKLNDWINNFGGHFIPITFFNEESHAPITLSTPVSSDTMSSTSIQPRSIPSAPSQLFSSLLDQLTRIPITPHSSNTSSSLPTLQDLSTSSYSIKDMLAECFEDDINAQSGSGVANESFANILFEETEQTCRKLLKNQYNICTTALHSSDLYMHAIYACQIARGIFGIDNGVIKAPLQQSKSSELIILPHSFLAQSFNVASFTWSSSSVVKCHSLAIDPSYPLGTEPTDDMLTEIATAEADCLEEIKSILNNGISTSASTAKTKKKKELMEEKKSPNDASIVVIIEPALLVGKGRTYRASFLHELYDVLLRHRPNGKRSAFLLADEAISCIRLGNPIHSFALKDDNGDFLRPDLVIMGKSLGGVSLLCVSDDMNAVTKGSSIHLTMQNAFTSTSPAALLAHTLLILRFVSSTPNFFNEITQQGKELHEAIEKLLGANTVRSIGLALFLDAPPDLCLGKFGDHSRLLPRLDQTAAVFEQMILAQKLVIDVFNNGSQALKTRLRLSQTCGYCCGKVIDNTIDDPRLTSICEKCPRIWHRDCYRKLPAERIHGGCPCGKRTTTTSTETRSSKKRK